MNDPIQNVKSPSHERRWRRLQLLVSTALPATVIIASMVGFATAAPLPDRESPRAPVNATVIKSAYYASFLSSPPLVSGQPDGELLYHTNCSRCHGLQAEGGSAPLLTGMAQTLKRQGISPEALGPLLINRVRQSKPPMPTFTVEELSDADILSIAQYLITLPGPPPTPEPQVGEPDRGMPIPATVVASGPSGKPASSSGTPTPPAPLSVTPQPTASSAPMGLDGSVGKPTVDRNPEPSVEPLTGRDWLIWPLVVGTSILVPATYFGTRRLRSRRK